MRRLLFIVPLFFCLPLIGATLYVDSAATGANSGANWANAFTNFYAITNVQPGDTVEVSGGTYPANPNYDQYEFHWGTSNAPVTVKHSQEVGHNGLSTIRVPLALQAYVHIDGSIVDNYETNFVSTWDVEKVTNNCGFWIDGGSNWVYDVLTLEGYRTDRPAWATAQYIYSNSIKWCLFAGGAPPPGVDVQDVPGLVNLDCIKAPNCINARGLLVEYNCFTNVIEGCVTCGHNELAFGSGVRIHNNLVKYGQNRSIGALYSGGVGADIWGNILNKYPMVFGGEQEDLQLVTWWRVWNNIFYTAGAATIQCYIDSGSNYSHCYFYGNLIVPNPTNWTVYPAAGQGNTYVQMSSEPTNLEQYYTNIFVEDWRWFNNTAICTESNGPASIVGFLSKGWLLSSRDGPAWATNVNLCNMLVVPGGVKFYNNLDWSHDATHGSAFSPNYTGFNSDAASKCYPDLCGIGKYNGWTYTTNDVVVDYNIFGSTLYLSNYSLTMPFTPSSLEAYAGFTHNSTNMPTFNNTVAEDYRPVGIATGIDLSEYATNMPGLLVDLNGKARTWGIGALESGTSEVVTNGLVVWLRFIDDAWKTNGIIPDYSGWSNNAAVSSDASWTGTLGRPSCCPAWTNGPNGMGGIYFTTNWTGDDTAGLGDPHTFGTYAGITNFNGGLASLTNASWALWAWNEFGSSDYKGTFLSAGTYNDGNANAHSWAFGIGGGQENEYWTGFSIFSNGAESSHLHASAIFTNATYAYVPTNWVHYAVTWDGTNYIGYRDGVAIDTNTLPGTTIISSNVLNRYIAIGTRTHDGTFARDDVEGSYMYPNHGAFVGRIADIRIYNRAITAGEVASIYGGTQSGGGETGEMPPPTTNSVTRVTISGATLRGGARIN